MEAQLGAGSLVEVALVAVSPAAGVKLPAIRNGRTRFASPAETVALLAAAPERDRPIWATAMYTGLRRGS